ncbi:MAG: CinA family protein [Sphingobium sp.]
MTDSLVHPQLAALAQRVVQENRRLGRTFALAESCTGGLVSAAITEVPGCSEVFDASFVTYSNEIKNTVLKVSQDVLETFGAVSIATAWAMAQGALERTHAQVAVAITGIAGPGGGSDNKPIGTVVFARAERGGDPDKVIADFKNFGDIGRAGVRLQAALCALELLLPDAEDP